MDISNPLKVSEVDKGKIKLTTVKYYVFLFDFVQILTYWIITVFSQDKHLNINEPKLLSQTLKI